MTKCCSVCTKTYQLDMFYKDSAKCKPCHKLHSRLWGQRNPQKKKEYNDKWLQTMPEDYVKEKSKRWRLANPDKSSEMVYRRRDIIKQRTPHWVKREDILCIYKEARLLGLQVDHIVPLVSLLVSGLHCPANMQLLTKSENSAKGNRYWADMPVEIKE